MNHNDRVKENKALCIKYGISDYERRKAYNRWKKAIERGHDVEFEVFLQNKRVQIKKGKPKKYWVYRRIARIALAMPKWVNIDEIAEFYANCPEGYHVDHIMPLDGENFSGLHVIWNLQYLPAAENVSKSNKI